MKQLITIATALLISAGPAFAAKTATPAQWKDIHALYKVFGHCGGVDWKKELNPARDMGLKACALSDKLQKKLAAQGFCTYGHIEIGWPSNDGVNCCELDDRNNPDPLPKEKRFKGADFTHCD